MKKVLILATCLVLLLAGAAQADTLTLGSHVTWIASTWDGTNVTVGGGSFDYASLTSSNGTTPLKFIYCVDFLNHISLNTTYGPASVTDTGVANGVPIYNAEKVAWLLGHYGTGGNGLEAYALQAAIWDVIYDGTGTGGFAHKYDLGASAPPDVVTLYNSMLTALSNRTDEGHISNYLWITPDSNTNKIQGQVASVPEVGTLILFGTGLVGLVGYRRVRRMQ